MSEKSTSDYLHEEVAKLNGGFVKPTKLRAIIRAQAERIAALERDNTEWQRHYNEIERKLFDAQQRVDDLGMALALERDLHAALEREGR